MHAATYASPASVRGQLPRGADQQLGIEVRLQVSDPPADGKGTPSCRPALEKLPASAEATKIDIAVSRSIFSHISRGHFSGGPDYAENARLKHRSERGLRIWLAMTRNLVWPMTQTARASFTSDASRNSARITLQSTTWRILYRRAKSRCSSARTTLSAITPWRSWTTARH